jgi:hypothetical protein
MGFYAVIFQKSRDLKCYKTERAECSKKLNTAGMSVILMLVIISKLNN